TVNAGALLATSAALTVTGTKTFNGSFQLNQSGSITSAPTYGASSTLIYAGTSAQTTNANEFPSASGPANLTISNSAGVNLNFARTITGALAFTAGKLMLGANDLTVGSVSGFTSSKYVVTDGAGKLIMTPPASMTTTYPVGVSATSYDPVTVNPTNSVSFQVNVKSISVAGDFTGMINNFAKVAMRQWDIAATGTGSTVVSLHNGGTSYVPPIPVIGHYTGGMWTETPATFISDTWTATFSSFSPFGGGSQGGFTCTLPTVNTNPSPQQVCENSSALFTASFDGGDPVPTLRWQVSTDGGMIWNDLTETSPYSGTTTNTLTINPASFSLNGNQYRLKATNTCGDVPTNGAVLVVYLNPTANAGMDDATCGLTYTLAAIPPLGSGTWTTAGPGTAFFSPGPNVPNAQVTVSAYGDYTFTWTVVNGPCDPVADDVNVSFYQAAFIDTPPVNAEVCDGGEQSFSMSALGTLPINYQWQAFIGMTWINLSEASPYTGTTTN
ncbi:MAG TPA: hypothetical protein VJ508_15270, partial [Saprospiraceae bacterium]|nr:hypothetical protein [Saprospiraceae bacterium]